LLTLLLLSLLALLALPLLTLLLLSLLALLALPLLTLLLLSLLTLLALPLLTLLLLSLLALLALPLLTLLGPSSRAGRIPLALGRFTLTLFDLRLLNALPFLSGHLFFTLSALTSLFCAFTILLPRVFSRFPCLTTLSRLPGLALSSCASALAACGLLTRLAFTRLPLPAFLTGRLTFTRLPLTGLFARLLLPGRTFSRLSLGVLPLLTRGRTAGLAGAALCLRRIPASLGRRLTFPRGLSAGELNQLSLRIVLFPLPFLSLTIFACSLLPGLPLPTGGNVGTL
jgi:hypothetical protein